jgi:hypothetical protein
MQIYKPMPAPPAKIGTVQRVVNHPSDIQPPYPSHVLILHLFPGQKTVPGTCEKIGFTDFSTAHFQ